MKVEINIDEFYPFYYIKTSNENEEGYDIPDELFEKYNSVYKLLKEVNREINKIQEETDNARKNKLLNTCPICDCSLEILYNGKINNDINYEVYKAECLKCNNIFNGWDLLTWDQKYNKGDNLINGNR